MQLLQGRDRQARRDVRPAGGHRVERVGDRHDPRHLRHGVALEPVRESRPVDPLVMRAHDLEHPWAIAQQRREDLLADHRVLHDVQVLVVRQPRGLVEHFLTDADLADVVQLGADAEVLERRRIQAERARDGVGVRGHARRVAAGVGVLGFQRVRQRLHPLEEQLLDATRLLLHALLEVVLVVAVLEDQPALLEGLTHPRLHVVHLERLGHVVERALRQAPDRAREVRDGGDHHDARVGPARPHLGQQLDAVHLRHPDVGHEQLRRLPLQLAQRLAAARGRPAREPLRGQQPLEDAAEMRLVVHDEAAQGSCVRHVA